MKLIATIAQVVLTVLTLSSCEGPYPRACTLIGCNDGFTLRLDHSNWAHGDYQFDIEIDGEKQTCKVTLPFSGCNQGVEPCSSGKANISLSGCALPSNQHSVAEVFVTATFGEMKLKVAHESTVLLERSFRPEFKTSQP